MSTYAEFLARKEAVGSDPLIDVQPSDVHPFLHDWQAEIVAWAARTGRAAVWADTGLGAIAAQIFDALGGDDTCGDSPC